MLISCSQSAFKIRQSIRNCSVLPLNGGMTCLGHQDEFPMVIALVCMIIH